MIIQKMIALIVLDLIIDIIHQINVFAMMAIMMIPQNSANLVITLG